MAVIVRHEKPKTSQILPLKIGPQWILPLVTALVILAVIMVLYQPT